MSTRLIKLISSFLSFCLIFEHGVFAQSIDLSHYFAHSPAQAIPQSDKFRPLHLRYISYDSQANDFKLLLDKGDFMKGLSPKVTVPDERLQEETQTLMKYFFIVLSLPNEKFWVNLRPDSPDNILDPDLEKTDIGRIFLEADVQLKKDTAGMTSPQTPEGKVYWDKLYKKAGELFGSENITIPTLTRPWIVPNEIIIREAPDNAYIYKATLKVMLEEDYLKGYQPSAFSSQQSSPNFQPLTSNYSFSDPRLKELNKYSTQLIKETIIPKLTYAVNTSKRYAPLRQVYYSLILAQWFKQKYGPQSPVSGLRSAEQNNPYIKLIDSGSLTSNFQLLTSQSPYSKETYFQQYQKSFKDGEYNLQEPVYTPMGQSIRRYISGGMQIDCSSAIEAGKIKATLKPFFSKISLPFFIAVTAIYSSIVFKEKIKPNPKVVKELISAINEKGGKINFADYMSICLYGDGGYYTSGTVNIGDGRVNGQRYKGDFSTFPESSPHAFGYGLAEKIYEMWNNMENPNNFQVVEMGAGNGTTAKIILEYIQQKYPEFMNSLTYTIVEISPALIERQKKTMQGMAYPVRWILGSAIEMPLKNVVGVFLSNELPDAFPVRLVRKDPNDRIKEVFVTYKNGVFMEELGDILDPGINKYINMLRNNTISNEVKYLFLKNTPINLNMIKWQKDIYDSLKRGYMITFDYGYNGPAGAGDLGLRVYGDKHKFKFRDSLLNSGEYIYTLPGQFDITANVNLKTLLQNGEEKGFSGSQLIEQGEFFAQIPEKVFKGYLQERANLAHKDFYVLTQGKDVLPIGSLPARQSFSSSAVEGGEKKLRELLSKHPKLKIEYDLFKEFGVGLGTNILEIGIGSEHRGTVAAAMGAHYRQYEISGEIYGFSFKEYIDSIEIPGYKYEFPLKNNLSSHNGHVGEGTYNYIRGEFSGGNKSVSNKIGREGYVENKSQDIIIAMTGALSDPIPESNAHDVLREMLRVLKPGGMLVVGTYGLWGKDIGLSMPHPELHGYEFHKFRKVVSDVLKEPEWRGKVLFSQREELSRQDFDHFFPLTYIR